MNSIKDILEESLKQGETSKTLSLPYILATVIVATLCALIIYFVYKKFYRGAVYSENFNILNVMLCIITSFIITTISSNIILSLGMVGALSIVRFRSAVKDPLDIGFLFWSISAGIAAGAHLYPLAIVSTILLSAIYILFSLFSTGRKTYLLVIKYFDTADEEVRKNLADVSNTLKSKSQYKGKTELTLQVRLKKDDTSFVKKISDTAGVDSAMLIEYTGDYI
jgi:ABC-type Fe3+ transport system permease subunit